MRISPFSANWLKPGLVYFVAFLALLAGVILLERQLGEARDRPSIVRVVPDAGGREERVDPDRPELDAASLDPSIHRLVQSIAVGSQGWSAIAVASPVQGLNDQQRLLLRLGLAREWYQRQNFGAVVDVLSSVAVQVRLEDGVQFAYAFSLSQSGATQEAIAEYRQLVSHQPRSQFATLNLALLLKKSSQCGAAMPVFNRAIKISSGVRKAKAYAGLGGCFHDQGAYEEAVKNFSKSIEYRPDSSRVWAQLGESAVRFEGGYLTAIDAYDKATALSPGDVRLYLNKAKIQLRRYDYASVVRTLESIDRLGDASAEVHGLLAWAYLELGNRTESRNHATYLHKHALTNREKERAQMLLLYLNKEYNRLISTLRGRRALSPEYLYLQGISLRKLNHYASAEAAFKLVAESENFSLRSRVQIARIARSRSNYEEAAREFEALTEVNATPGYLWFELSLTYESMGQPTLALSTIDKAIAQHSDNKIYRLSKVRFLDALEQTEEAILVLRELLEESPKYLRALNVLATLLDKTGEDEALLGVYERIIKLDAGNQGTMIRYARLLSQYNREETSQRLLLDVVAQNQGSVEARFLLAVSYYKTLEVENSLGELEAVLRLDPEHSEALKLRELILSQD